MLIFKSPSILEYNNQPVNSADFLLKLESTVDANYVATLTLKNKVTKVIYFVRQGNNFKARLIIRDEDLNFLEGSTLKIKAFNPNFNVETLPVTLKWDLPSIQLNIKQFISRDYEEVMSNLIKLENKLDGLVDKGVLKGIKIINPELAKKGMVPVVADDKGNYVPQYPFANIIKEVNGLQAVNEKLFINAADIPLSEKNINIQEILTELSKAIKQQALLIKELARIQTKLSDELKETKLKLAEHLNSGII
jgi:hypothetical protein